jgi:hypothetical protein
VGFKRETREKIFFNVKENRRKMKNKCKIEVTRVKKLTYHTGGGVSIFWGEGGGGRIFY